MSNYSSEFKVGLFVILAGVIFSFLSLATRDAPFGVGESYTLYTTTSSAEGIQFGSMVLMAGVRVGRVGTISLSQGKARIELEIDRQYLLPEDSHVIVKSMGILGDKSVHILPGSASNFLKEGSEIPYGQSTGDIDQLTQKLSDVATDIKAMSGDLKSVTASIKSSLSESEMNKMTASVQKILENIAQFTSTIDNIGSSNQQDISAIVANMRMISQNLKDLMESSKSIVASTGKDVSDEMKSIQTATKKLDEGLEKINRIVDKVEQGEGSVGALLKDKTTIDSLNETISGANDILDKINRFHTDVTYRGDFYALGNSSVKNSAKHTLGVKLSSRSDYYYLFEVVSDPFMDSTIREVSYGGSSNSVRRERIFTDAYQFTFQFAKRWNDLTLRLGVKENHGAVGADYFLLKDKVQLSLDLYDFSSNPKPNIELRGRLNIYKHLYVSAGLDDIWNRANNKGVNLFFGGGITFQDDDIKYILSYLPK